MSMAQKLKYITLFGLYFFVSYRGIQLLAPHVPSVLELEFQFERHIPFIPQFVIFYFAVYILFVILFLALKNEKDFKNISFLKNS